MFASMHLRYLAVCNSGLEVQLPAQVVQSKVALLLRAHFSNDIAETAVHEPILFGALKESMVLDIESQFLFCFCWHDLTST